MNEEEEIAHKMLGVQFYEQLEVLRKLMSDALYTEDVHQVCRAGRQSLESEVCVRIASEKVEFY